MTAETETPAQAAPLHLIFLIDASGSMWRDDLIRHVNFALRKGLPELRLVARDHPRQDLLIRVARFGDGAEWHVDVPAALSALEWSDIWANGGTDMGAGLRLVARDLRPGAFPADASPPILILLSDGFPTDDFPGGLRALLSQPWGRRSRRFAIAVGPDADRESLKEFVDGDEERLLIAETAAEVADQMRELFTERIPPLLEEPVGTVEDAGGGIAPASGTRWRAAGSGLQQSAGPTGLADRPNGRKAVRWVTHRGIGVPLALAGAVGSMDPGCFRSLIGAQIAAQVGSAWLLEALTPRRAKAAERKQPLGLSAQALTVAMVEQWRRLVLSHFHSFPFTDEEMEGVAGEGASTLIYEMNPAVAYGATIAAVVLTESHIVSLRLGGGGVLSMTQDGDVFQPFLGQTAEEIITLSDPDAAKHIQTVVQDAGEMMPTLLLCYPEGAPPADAAEELSARLMEVLESHRVGKVTAVDTWLLQAAQPNEGEEAAVGIAYNVAPFE
jgi:uncharacterized protein YegL